jgi:glycosyltransferase involved in cell wall biosynthesis
MQSSRGPAPLAAGTSRLVWLHRGTGAELWLLLRQPDDGDVADPSSLVLQPPDAGAAPTERPLIARESGGNGRHREARVDLAEALQRSVEAGRWRILVRTSAGLGRIEPSPGARRLRMTVECGTRVYDVACEEDEQGLVLDVAPAGAWCEVESIAPAGRALRVLGRIVGRPIEALPEATWELLLRSRDHRAEHVLPAMLNGQRFEVDIRDLPDEDRTWDLWLRPSADSEVQLRLGRHLDDVPRKDRALVYAWRRIAGSSEALLAQPRYTPSNDLSLGARPKPAAPKAGSAGPPAAPAQSATDRPTSRPRMRPQRTTVPTVRRGFPWLRRAAVRGAFRSVRAAFAVVALASRVTRLRRRRAGEAAQVYLLLGNAYAMGGTIRTVWNLAAGLAQHMPVHLLSVFQNVDESFFEADPRVNLRTLVDRRPNPPGTSGRWKRTLRAALDRRRSVLVPRTEARYRAFSLLSDIEIVRTLWKLPPGVLMSTRPALNVIAARYAPGWLTIVGQEHLALSAHRPRLREELLRAYRSLDAITVLTRADAQDYEAALADGRATGRPLVRHIPNALPDVPFPRSDLTTKVVVAAGRFAVAKRFDLLVSAFARVVQQRPDWTLRIYGAGRTGRRVRRLIQRHGLSEHVILMGPTDRLPQEMAKASIFALSSRFEGFGMVLIEAFKCGLPAVSFACPRGPRELVEHEINGLLVPELDVEALADALVRMMDDEQLRRRCAAGALRTAEEYSMPRVAQRWRDLFRELEMGSTRPDR